MKFEQVGEFSAHHGMVIFWGHTDAGAVQFACAVDMLADLAEREDEMTPADQEATYMAHKAIIHDAARKLYAAAPGAPLPVVVGPGHISR